MKALQFIGRLLKRIIYGDSDATAIAKGCAVLVIGLFVYFYLKDMTVGMVLCGISLIIIGGLKKIYE